MCVSFLLFDLCKPYGMDKHTYMHAYMYVVYAIRAMMCVSVCLPRGKTNLMQNREISRESKRKGVCGFVCCVCVIEIPNICIRIEYWFVVVTQCSFVCSSSVYLYSWFIGCLPICLFTFRTGFCLMVNFTYVCICVCTVCR